MNVHRKTILSSAFILILSIIIIISVQTYCESNNVVLNGNDIEIPINQEGIFYINVSGIEDLAFLTIDVTWDPTVLTVTDVNDTVSDFNIVFSEIHANQGRVDIDAYSFDEPLDGDSIVVCSLICEATDDADVGDSCDVLFENSILWNSTGNEVEHISQTAIVNITEDESGNVIVFIDDAELALNENGLSLINISGVEKLAFVTLEVVWDPAVIKIADINDTVSDFDLVFSNLNTNAGHLSIQAYRFDETGIYGDVVICGLAVGPADQAVVGESTTMNVNKSILWNVSIDTIDHVKNNGTIDLVDAQSSNTDEVNLYANDITIPIDESGLVHVNASTNTDIGYLSLNLTWDSSVVQLDEVNDSLSDFDMIYSYQSDDYVRIDAYAIPTSLTGDVIICGLLFSAADGSSAEDVSSVIFTDASVSDDENNSLMFTVDDGLITLSEASDDGDNDDNNGNDDDNGSNGGSTGGTSGGGIPPPVIVENTDPVAVIVVSSREEYINTDINFDASKSTDEDGDSLTYHWDFGDGYDSTSEKPTHSYSSPDVYLVTLTVDDGQGGSDTETIDISINPPGNNPPTQLVVTESTTYSHQNTSVTFSAVAVDEDDNDTIRYVFDWDDGSDKTISDYMNSSLSYETTHQWSTYGKYTVKVLAEDNENARSETVRITMLIDIKEISGDIDGWLIDENSDGTYDSFKNLETNSVSSIDKINDSYCRVDTDNDDSWDYEINLKTNVLTAYAEKKTDDEDDSSILYLLGLVIIVFIVLIVLLNRKKPTTDEKKSSEKKSKKSK